MPASSPVAWSLACLVLVLYVFSSTVSASGDIFSDGTSNETEIANCKPDLGRFMCKNENQCVDAQKVCNRVPDCSDGSDEFPDCDKSCKKVKCAMGCVPNPDSSKLGRCYCSKGYKISGTNRDRCTNINECDLWETCSQRCDDLDGSFECSCLEGFRLGDDKRNCTPIETEIKVVFALKSSIRVWSSSAQRHFSIVENQGQTVGVAVDVKNDFVYWTDVSEGKEAIYRTKVNGEGAVVEKIVDQGLILPEGIAFDWITGNIYFTDSNRSHIVACTGDGKFCSVVIEFMDKPREIALHPGQGLMFWTDWGEKASIIRAGMDGSTPLPIISADLRWPNGLAVDHGNSRLYWSDAYHDQIETSSLTGGDRHIVSSEGVHHPFSLEVFGDTLFWTDWHLMEVLSCTKFACKNPRALVKSSAASGHPNGLAIFHPAAQPSNTRTNPCSKAKCSHICVLAGLSNYACLCPAGMILDRTRKICIDDERKAQILIGHENSLNTMRFNSIGREVIEEKKIKDIKTIGAILYNPVNDTIFISDLHWKTIYEYNRQTGQLTTLLTRHLDSVKSIALDVIGHNLYWADSSRRRVEVMSLRTGARALITMEAEHPQAIIVVPEIRSLFIAQTGRRGGRILKMDMNGYHRKTMVRCRDRGEPVALTYNSDIGHIFWADAVGESVEHVPANSVGETQYIAVKHTGHPFSIASFGNRVFWTDSHTQLLHVVPVYALGRNELPVFIGRHEDRNKTSLESYVQGNFLAKITMMHKDISRYDNLTKHHECSASLTTPKCSHICLMSGDLDVGTCFCPEGMQLDTTGHTCSWAGTCFGTQFKCNNNNCINSEYKCDGFNDCAGGEDEMGCDLIKKCKPTDFTCENDKTCVPMAWRCDGEPDCSDRSDERNCNKSCKSKSEFQCDDGQCIPYRWKCDNQYECKDKSDEKDCNMTCPVGSFQCISDLKCISTDWVCDGDADCIDESDEHEHCDLACTQNSFRCLNHHCIEGFLVCNGVSDCSDNSDEFECGARRGGSFNITATNNAVDEVVSTTTEKDISEREACPANTYTCDTGACIPYKTVCDKLDNCGDGSDEGPGCATYCNASQSCSQKCLTSPRGPVCACDSGFELDMRDKRSCMDIDECAIGKPCDHICDNTKGSFKCSCHEEYSLRSDKRRCKPKHKPVKTHLLNGGNGETSSEETLEMDKTNKTETIVSQESRSPDSDDQSSSSTSAVGIVFGVIFLLLLLSVIVGFVLHRKRIHPKVLFERYGQQIMVRFRPRSRQPRREQLGSEAIYDDVCDNSRTYSSGAYANPVYEDLDRKRKIDVNWNGETKENSHSLADSGILNVMDTDPNHLYEELDDHLNYSHRDTLLDKEFV